MRSSGVNAASTFSIESLSGRVGHVLGLGVEDGVVVAAAQLERDLAVTAARPSG
jgi:hypothetical protein